MVDPPATTITHQTCTDDQDLLLKATIIVVMAPLIPVLQVQATMVGLLLLLTTIHLELPTTIPFRLRAARDQTSLSRHRTGRERSERLRVLIVTTISLCLWHILSGELIAAPALALSQLTRMQTIKTWIHRTTTNVNDHLHVFPAPCHLWHILPISLTKEIFTDVIPGLQQRLV
jgi:hypothetical protein